VSSRAFSHPSLFTTLLQEIDLFRVGRTVDLRIVQKSQVAGGRMSRADVARTPDRTIRLMPDCASPPERTTVTGVHIVKFIGVRHVWRLVGLWRNE
jgi:hypothetical protein